MTQVRKVPQGDVQQMMSVMGVMALPVVLFQSGISLLCQASCLWTDMLFKPHENPTEKGAQLTVPEPLAKDMEHDLFA